MPRTNNHVTFVSPMGDSYAPTNFIREKDTECIFVKSILDVYPLLSDSNFHTNVISLDIEALYEQHGMQVWDLVNALATIIKSTVCRINGKSAKRTTVISGGVTLSTDIKLIKDFLSLNDLVVGVFPRGPEFSLEEKLIAMNAFQASRHHVPEKIQKLINKNKKAKEPNSDIVLTPRQEQVLKLIKERGASNKVIARMLSISESTVKLHVGQIIKKFGVKNRTQLALFTN